jgi:hypothetical protein
VSFAVVVLSTSASDGVNMRGVETAGARWEASTCEPPIPMDLLMLPLRVCFRNVLLIH